MRCSAFHLLFVCNDLSSKYWKESVNLLDNNGKNRSGERKSKIIMIHCRYLSRFMLKLDSTKKKKKRLMLQSKAHEWKCALLFGQNHLCCRIRFGSIKMNKLLLPLFGRYHSALFIATVPFEKFNSKHELKTILWLWLKNKTILLI